MKKFGKQLLYLNKSSLARYTSLVQSPHLSGEDLEIYNLAKSFATQKILPLASENDLHHRFPKEVIQSSAELGFAGVYTSSQYGGCEMTRLQASLIFQGLATACVATSAYISIHNMNNFVLDAYSSTYLKENYLPRLHSFELMSSYCLTEPNSGSDAQAMKTSAKKQGDDVVLNGSKCFISNAGISDVYLVMARSGEKEISCYLVEKDTKGLSFGKIEEKMGWKSSHTRMVIFDEVRIPARNLIGAQGEGFKIAMSALDGGRVNIASCSLGAAETCLESAIQYIKDRKQFGKKLSEFQHLQFKVSEMAGKLVACKLMLQNAAVMLDQKHQDKTMYCAMAKQFVTDECFEIVDGCLQLFGGYGYLSEYQIERYLRDIRVNRILEGTNEIMKLIISRNLLK